ncbi:MAG: ABC transporter permease [Thermoguttaceae bacterium]|nr:ABC transporter permease [Thermoguttaceae bacterium]
MSVLNRKLWRDLGQLAGSLAAVAVLMALGNAAFITLASAYRNLEGARREYYAQCRMADFWVQCERVPRTLLTRVASVAGVGSWEARIVKYVSVFMPGQNLPAGGLAVSLPDDRLPNVNRIVLLQGRYFDGLGRRQVIVGRPFARHYQLRLGDRLRMILNGRLETFEVVGIAVSSEFVYLSPPGSLLPDPKAFGVFFLPESVAEEVFDLAGSANEVVGHLVPTAQTERQTIVAQLEAVLASAGVHSAYLVDQQLSHQFLSQELASLQIFAVAVPAVFLLVATMVLTMLMRRIVERQRTVIGLLKALGYTDWEVAWHYAKLATVVGLLGSLLGIGVGQWAAAAMTDVYREYFEFPRLQSQPYPALWFVTLTANALCIWLGSARGLRAVLRLQPAEALRPKAPRSGGALPFEQLIPWWHALSWSWRGALREIYRHPARSALTAGAILGAVALVGNTLMMMDSTWFMVEFQFSKVARSNLDISFVHKKRAASVRLAGKRLAGVTSAEPMLYLPCTLIHGRRQRKLAITGVPKGAKLTVPHDREGRAVPIPPVGLLLTRKVAEILAVAPGQQIVVEFTEGHIRRQVVPVAAIVDTFIGLEAFAELGYLSRLVGHRPICSALKIRALPGPEGMESIVRQAKLWPEAQTVSPRWQSVQSLRRIVAQNLGVFLGVILVFAGGLFVGTVVSSIVVTASERATEMATLHALGFTRREIAGLFYRENAQLSLLGTVAGLGGGWLLTVALSRAYESELFRFPVIWNVNTALWTIVFVLAAHGATYFAFLCWLKRVDLREALYLPE